MNLFFTAEDVENVEKIKKLRDLCGKSLSSRGSNAG
jgi:hypothetical protein